YKMVFANVDHASVSSLAAWENFYVIVGSSAAALTGLQFVVMALVAETRRPSSRETIDAFGTPTILHFAFVLLLASIVAAPWPTLSSAAIAIGACGLVGVVYVCIVIRRTRRQSGYAPVLDAPVLEDWIWHIVLPLAAHQPAQRRSRRIPRLDPRRPRLLPPDSRHRRRREVVWTHAARHRVHADGDARDAAARRDHLRHHGGPTRTSAAADDQRHLLRGHLGAVRARAVLSGVPGAAVAVR